MLEKVKKVIVGESRKESDEKKNLCLCERERECVKCSLDSVLTAAGEGDGVQIPIQQNTEQPQTHTHTFSLSPLSKMLRHSDSLAKVFHKSSHSQRPALSLCWPRPGLKPPTNTYIHFARTHKMIFSKRDINLQ